MSRSLLTQRLYELLSDGQWHEREPVLAAAAVTVTPGVAVRAMQKMRETERRCRPTLQSRQCEVDWRWDVPKGQRRVALLTIHNNRRIECRVEEGVKQVRLRPPMDRKHGADGRFAPTALTEIASHQLRSDAHA